MSTLISGNPFEKIVKNIGHSFSFECLKLDNKINVLFFPLNSNCWLQVNLIFNAIGLPWWKKLKINQFHECPISLIIVSDFTCTW
jgi:hypothetical protein